MRIQRDILVKYPNPQLSPQQVLNKWLLTITVGLPIGCSLLVWLFCRDEFVVTLYISYINLHLSFMWGIFPWPIMHLLQKGSQISAYAVKYVISFRVSRLVVLLMISHYKIIVSKILPIIFISAFKSVVLLYFMCMMWGMDLVVLLSPYWSSVCIVVPHIRFNWETSWKEKFGRK